MSTNQGLSNRARLGVSALLILATALAAQALPIRGDAPASGVAAGPPRIEVVFVLDTTGSMSGLIEGAKQKIWSIANQMASGQPTPEIRVGLVGYRDRGDAYQTRVTDLSGDLDAIYASLAALRADGGGDTPESVNQALHEAVTRLSWSDDQNVYKVVFLVGDAPPHMDYSQDVPYTESVRLARERGIIVNTVQCGGMQSTTPVWQAIAAAGAGRYAAIRQDGGMVAVVTPMDEKLAMLNRELAGTVVAYGKASERAETLRKRDAAVAAPAPAAAARLGYMAKTGGRVNSGRADLIDAIKEGLTRLASVSEEALPAELQALAPEERDGYIEQKLEARKKVQRKIADLASQRDAFLEQDRRRRAAEGAEDGFDDEVLTTLRSQAAARGIAY